MNHLLEALEAGSGRPPASESASTNASRSLPPTDSQLDILPVLPNKPPHRLARELRLRLGQIRRDVTHTSDERRLVALHRLRDLLHQVDVSTGPPGRDPSLTIHPRRDALVAFALAPSDDPPTAG